VIEHRSEAFFLTTYLSSLRPFFPSDPCMLINSDDETKRPFIFSGSTSIETQIKLKRDSERG
jgi:hypothetical protein